MKLPLPKFLRIPKSHRRTQSEARSQISPTERQSEAGPAVPHLAESTSTPDLRASTSTLFVPGPFPRDHESNSMYTILLRASGGLSKRIFSSDADPSTIPNQTLPAPGNDQSDLQRPSDDITDPRAVSVSKSDWKSTVSKQAIDLVNESSDAFPPLKFVAEGLSAILGHCEVRHIYLRLYHPWCLLLFQQKMACRQAMESLIPRVEELAASLRGPVLEGEVKEYERRTILDR